MQVFRNTAYILYIHTYVGVEKMNGHSTTHTTDLLSYVGPMELNHDTYEVFCPFVPTMG